MTAGELFLLSMKEVGLTILYVVGISLVIEVILYFVLVRWLKSEVVPCDNAAGSRCGWDSLTVYLAGFLGAAHFVHQHEPAPL